MKRIDEHAMAATMSSRNTWRASLSLGFADDNGTTRLIERAHDGPLLVQKPLYPEGNRVCHAIVVHPPGGVVGGDTLTMSARVQDRAHAFITTPGAAKWYRANGQVSRQKIGIDIGAGAVLEWLPQETILFNGADIELEQDVRLAADASYLGWEVLCFGRTASGEVFNTGRVRQRNRITRGGKLVWWEQGRLSAGRDAMASPLTLAGHTVCATFIAVGDGMNAALLQNVRQAMEDAAANRGRCGATLMKQVCVARYLGNASEVAKAVMHGAWQALRPALVGRDAATPRIWNT